MANYSRNNETSVVSIATERQVVGETAIRITTEITLRLQEIPASKGNAKTVEKDATGMLIVGTGK